MKPSLSEKIALLMCAANYLNELHAMMGDELGEKYIYCPFGLAVKIDLCLTQIQIMFADYSIADKIKSIQMVRK